jgi:hypothetical protein
MQSQLGTNQMMGSGLMGLAGLGSGFLGQAHGAGMQNLGLGFGAGDYMQNYQQSLSDADRAKHDFQQTAPWIYEMQRLNALQGLGSAYGTQTSSNSTGLGSVLAGMGSAALMGGMNPMTLFGGLGGMFGGGGGYGSSFTNNPASVALGYGVI